MDGQALIAALGAHNYFIVAVLVVGWLTRLTSDASRFPVSFPRRWQPVLVVCLGQLYAVLEAIAGGTSVKDAVLDGLIVALFTMGLFDLVIKAIFNGQEPRWIAWLALIFPAPPSAEKIEQEKKS